MRLPLGDRLNPLGGELVHDPADRDLVARDLLRRKDDAVAGVELERVGVVGNAGQGGARLALAAGGDNQHLVPRQAHRSIEINRLGELAQITGRARDLQDAIERAAGDAQLAAGRLRHLAQRLQPRGVGGEGGDHHPALGGGDDLVQSGLHALFGARCLSIEHIGRIAHQGKHALVTDRAQRLSGGRLAEHGRVVKLPVAGVEHTAIRRVDQQRVAFGNRMRHRHEGDAERAHLEPLARLDDAQRHLVGNALLLQLAADQARGEGRGIDRHVEIEREIGQRADMVFMAVRDDDAGKAVELILDEAKIGQDHVDAGIIGIGEGHAAIDHHPLALTAIEVDVHADLARAAERAKEQFVLGGHSSLS